MGDCTIDVTGQGKGDVQTQGLCATLRWQVCVEGGSIGCWVCLVPGCVCCIKDVFDWAAGGVLECCEGPRVAEKGLVIPGGFFANRGDAGARCKEKLVREASQTTEMVDSEGNEANAM